MRLTLHTDYAFRVLIALAREKDRIIPVEELADEFGVSKNHLMKVARNLAANGFAIPVRGRRGGLRLARAASDINLRDVAERMEPDFTIAECFGRCDCSFLPRCKLKGLLGLARDNFLTTLGSRNLSDIV